MAADGLAPDEQLNKGEQVPARAAAAVILVRDVRDGVEVLLAQRNPEARFMGGAWVFPGGAVLPSDATAEQGAVRELAEEAGVQLDGPEVLTPYSHWITPAEVSVRFDTRFFVAPAPEGAEPVCDGAECVAVRWIRPGDALQAHERGELSLVFPTIKHLEQLARFASVRELIEHAERSEVVPVQPKIVEEGRRVVMPGEPGYGEP